MILTFFVPFVVVLAEAMDTFFDFTKIYCREVYKKTTKFENENFLAIVTNYQYDTYRC